jgi:hypothetical protein
MTKRKTTATGFAKTSGQDGKPSAALPVGYANLLTDIKARVTTFKHRRMLFQKVFDDLSPQTYKAFQEAPELRGSQP